jgi:hypothetical protein
MRAGRQSHKQCQCSRCFVVGAKSGRFALSNDDTHLVKLDIEGAAAEVIDNKMCDNAFLPAQLLVEFDEMTFPIRTLCLASKGSEVVCRPATNSSILTATPIVPSSDLLYPCYSR